MILAIVDDLIFRSKLETAAGQLGTPLRVSADAAAALRAGQPWSQALIDLNLNNGDPLGMIRALRAAQPQARIIGYCSHVQQLPELLRG